MALRLAVRTFFGPSRRRDSLRVCAALIVLLALVVSIASFALAAPAGFSDVPATHPYYASITDLASRGIINGYADGRFGPGERVTRQQFAKMIVKALGYPVSEADVCPFPDVPQNLSDDDPLYPDNYVAVCAAHGITTGKSATTFDPYGYITRYQVVSMVVRGADDVRPDLLATPSTGWAGAAGWEVDPEHGANAARAEYSGLLSGFDLAALSPYGYMNRGEVAQILHSLLGKLAPVSTTTSMNTTTTQPPSTTTTNSPTTTTGPTTTTTDAATPGATYNNPIPFQHGALVGDWSVYVVGSLDITEEISNPDPELEYLRITVRAKYFGSASSTFTSATRIRIVSVSGKEFTAYSNTFEPSGAVPQYGEVLGSMDFRVPTTDKVYRLLLEKNGDAQHKTRTYFQL